MDSHAEPIHRVRMVLPVFLAFTITIILSHPTSSTALSLQRHRSSVVNGTPFARKWKPINSRPTKLCSTPPGDAVDVGNFISNMGGDSTADGDGFPAQINGGTNGDNCAKIQSTSQSPARSTFFPLVLWRFTRPHTLIGSALAIPSIFLLAAPTYRSFFTLRTFAALSYAVIPSLLMNIYITGLNQITDVEIDKINKPDLPMANGDLNYSTATGVVLASLIISLAMSVIHPTLSTSGLQVALWGSFLLGTMYSLPPIRMKKHPFLAAFCIVAVRGIIVNAGFYSHALSSAFGSAALPSGAGVLSCLLHDRKCALSSFFFGVFGIVIALMKDVPDVDGDRIFNIRSYTVRLGQKRVFSTMKNLLTALFGVFGGGLMRWSIMTPTMGSVAVRRGLVGLGCWAAGWTVNRKARGVNPEDSGEVYNYYMYLWKLFYLSYLALPFVK